MKTFYAKFHGDEARTLYVMTDGGTGLPMGFRFDRATKGWVLDMSVLWELQEDMDVWEITPAAAEELETRFRAV